MRCRDAVGYLHDLQCFLGKHVGSRATGRRDTMRPMMSQKAVVAALIAASLTSVARAQSFATNLIVNGDAESGIGVSDDTSTSLVVPGWTRPVLPGADNAFSAVKYVAVQAPDSFPGHNSPGPADRGLNFFAGGPSTSHSLARQSIDLTALGSSIDTGVSYTLSGFLGGFDIQEDAATLTVSFRNGSELPIGSASIGPVGPLDRSGTGLEFRTTSGLVPVGTRSVVVTLDMARVDGDYNDGYADNLSFQLSPSPSPVPEPEAWALAVGAVLGGFALARRCRRGTSSK